MAIYHCSISNVSRAKGSSSCATLAYISGEKVHDDRLDKTYQYARSERVLETGTILPDSAPAEYANAEALFNAVEKHETADNARTAKKIQVALPRELELAEQKKIIEDYIRNNLAKEGYCATYAIHGDEKKTGNVHAHILVANRPINAKGKWGCKRKTVFEKDENGNRIPLLDKDGNQKKDGKGTPQWKRVNVEQNPLDKKEFLEKLRKEWATEVNKHLAPDHNLDHITTSSSVIEPTPTIHEGYAARAMEERGEVSERCQTNRDIRQENAERLQVKQELAAAIDQDKALEKKEREIHERFNRIDGRRKNDELTGRTPEGERATESTATATRAADPDHQTAREQAGRADRLRALLERREREATEIRREREEAERRQREVDEAKRRAREAAEAKRQRNSRTATTERGFSR